MYWTICPQCNENSYDQDTNRCTKCGMRGTVATPVLDQATLDGLLENARVALRDVGDNSFQQILGPFSPRVGYGPEDGIDFTEATAALVNQYFGSHGISCVWIALTANYITSHSVMIASTEKGLDRGVRVAKKAARQMRGRLEIKPPRSDG